MRRILIFANGNLPDVNKTRAILREDDYIICADGGSRLALLLGLKPALVIGDLDSTDNFSLQKIQAMGVQIETFPTDKNETDLELAIQRAVELKPQEIVIVAGLGGRLDQTLANIALLSDDRLSTLNLRLDDGVEEIYFCRDQVEVHGRSGDVVSLIPWGMPVHHIQTQGLQWPLEDETLLPEKSRGISNRMTSNEASIQIGSGLLLVVHERKD